MRGFHAWCLNLADVSFSHLCSPQLRPKRPNQCRLKKCNPSVTFHLQGTILTYQHATSDYALRFKIALCDCLPNFALHIVLAKFEKAGIFQLAALYRNSIENGIETLLDIPKYLQHFSHLTRTNSTPKKWRLLLHVLLAHVE